MDEADRLCDRIAIVDHGKLVASISRSAEASVAGSNVIEVQFRTRRRIGTALHNLSGVTPKARGRRHVSHSDQ